MVNRTTLLIALAAAIAASASRAQQPSGARAMAMGGAFTAIAEGDGADAWNPAAAAGRSGRRLLLPTASVMSGGSESLDGIRRALGSDWTERMKLLRRVGEGGSAAFQASVGAGYTGPGMGIGLQVFGRGGLFGIDFDGSAGHLTLTPDFTMAQLHDAAAAQYRDFGSSAATAESEATKIVSQVQRSYPGASTIALPTYGSRVAAEGDLYGSAAVTIGRVVRPNLRLGVNLKLVGARHVSAYARFDGETFTAKAADVTGGTASPALVDRVLARLNLRHTDGSLFSGGELAGSIDQGSDWGPIEVRPSVDLGALWRVGPRLQAGGVIRNLIPAHFVSAAPLNTSVTLGAAYAVVPRKLLIAADFTNLLGSRAARLNAGVEWSPIRPLALRAGVYEGRICYGFGFSSGFGMAFSPGLSLLSLSIGF